MCTWKKGCFFSITSNYSMHGERPMQVRRSKKFRTHEVTHSHFPMTLNKLELSDVLTVGSWERVRAVLKTVHGFDTQLCSCHCIRRGGCLISTCVAPLWWLTVNYRMTDTLSCFWGFFMMFSVSQGVVEFSLCLLFAKLVSYTFLYWLPLYISNVGQYLHTSFYY